MSGARTRRRALRTGALAAALLLAGAGPAAAHVEVLDGQGPVQGDYGVVQLSVPVESDSARTVGLTVSIPDGVDLASAATAPLPGWTATVTSADGGKRVTEITWRAEDLQRGGLSPGQFGVFSFSAGPWPEGRETVALPAVQTYSDGSVVRWNEISADGHTEAEHPAPTVTLRQASSHHGAAAAEEHGGGVGGIAQWVLLGLAVALSGVAVAVAAGRRRPAPVESAPA